MGRGRGNKKIVGRANALREQAYRFVLEEQDPGVQDQLLGIGLNAQAVVYGGEADSLDPLTPEQIIDMRFASQLGYLARQGDVA